jgi:DNA adenine methylase
MSVPHPIPYQGSKRRLAQAIIGHFPEDADRLIEPFAGSAAVSLAAARFSKARRFALSDANAPLMALWDAIISSPDDIAAQYTELWDAQLGREREYYDYVRDRFNEAHRPDHLLYLLARCVKASVRYNSNGEFNQSPDNRRRGATPDTMRHHIVRASKLLKGRATVAAADYRVALAAADETDVVYMDPPYQGVCGDRDQRYLGGVGFDAFVEALADLNKRGICYIVSYDGRTGPRTHGRLLPASLDLEHLEVEAGRSTQATLLGRDHVTYESLYLSPALMRRIQRQVSPQPRRSQIGRLGELAGAPLQVCV